jgi:hypothetical protein
MVDIYEVAQGKHPPAVTTYIPGRYRFTPSVMNLKGFLQGCAHLFYDSEGNHLFKDGSLHHVTKVIR